MYDTAAMAVKHTLDDLVEYLFGLLLFDSAVFMENVAKTRTHLLHDNVSLRIFGRWLEHIEALNYVRMVELLHNFSLFNNFHLLFQICRICNFHGNILDKFSIDAANNLGLTTTAKNIVSQHIVFCKLPLSFDWGQTSPIHDVICIFCQMIRV